MRLIALLYLVGVVLVLALDPAPRQDLILADYGVSALVVTILAAVASAAAQQRAARVQADNARRNAEIAQRAAADARDRGDAAVEKSRINVARYIARARAGIGASGAVVDEGSTYSIIEDAAAQGELDAETIQNNAAREAWGLETRAGGFSAAAENALVAGRFGAGASLLGGTASALSVSNTAGIGGGSQTTTQPPS